MLKKITVDQLRLGMHIHEFCGSWMEHPFWRSKFVLKDPADLRQIRACGIKELWIDANKGRDVDVTGQRFRCSGKCAWARPSITPPSARWSRRSPLRWCATTAH